MEAKTKDLWVFIETNEDGSPKKVGLELLNPGRTLATKQGGKLVGVVIGNNVAEAVEQAGIYGADQVIVVEGPEYQQFTTDAYVNALTYVVEKYGPTTVMIGATPNGRDLGPRFSSRLRTGLTADCTSLDIDEETGNVLHRTAVTLALVSPPDSEPVLQLTAQALTLTMRQAMSHGHVLHSAVT